MSLQTSNFDPLLCNVELPYLRTYYPVGFPLEIATNSEEILEGAQESWGHFRKTFFEPAVQLRIGVSDNAIQDCPPPPVCRGFRNLVTCVADASNYSVSDLQRGFAFSWLTLAVARNKPYLRYYFLEGMCWCLLASLYLTPIHAACVEKEGHGVLLCGDSGAGKSSLAFACARNHWVFLSDDASFLIRARGGRTVVGNPYQMWFRESAIEIFPELKDRQLITRVNGELAFEVPTATVPGIKTTGQCNIDYIVFLRRGHSGATEFRRLPKEKALQWFERTICYGEQDVRQAQKASLQNLLSAEVFELQYRDLHAAVRELDMLVSEGPSPEAQTSLIARVRENG